MVLTICLVLAIFSAVYILNKSRLVLFIIFISLTGVALTLSGVLRKKVLLMISASFLVVSIAFGYVYAKGQMLDSYQKYAGEGVYIYAKIAENYKFTSSGNLSINLTDVQIKTEAGYEKLNGKITLYTNPNNLDLTEFSAGRYLYTKTNLTVFDLNGGLKDNDRSLSLLSNGVIGYSYSTFYDIVLTDTYKISARDYICGSIRNNLHSADIEYADLGYAMLFGESSYLDDNIKEEFRLTGIAHLLAVSGLHFSIIFSIISFVAKASKANKKFSFLVQAVIIILYCYLCKFSVSVVRAGVMAFIAGFAKVRHKPYDSLSALTLVATLILCINPIKLFNISFILSFIAVLSITMLMPLFNNFFSKFFKDNIASTLAVNIAVQIGMFAVNLYYFGRYAVFSGIINLLLIPIATLAFGLLIISVILSRVFPLAIYLSKGFDFFIDIVVKINSYFTSGEFYLSMGNLTIIPVIMILLIMVCASDYIFIKKKNRIITISTFAIFTGLAFLL